MNPATRVSDSLPLSLFFTPVDDASFELDVLELLSTPGVRSQATAQGVVPQVPLVALAPMSAEWTACLTERWDSPAVCSAETVSHYVKDVVQVSSCWFMVQLKQVLTKMLARPSLSYTLAMLHIWQSSPRQLPRLRLRMVTYDIHSPPSATQSSSTRSRRSPLPRRVTTLVRTPLRKRKEERRTILSAPTCGRWDIC